MTAELALPDMPPSAWLDMACHRCGERRAVHNGRKHLGSCAATGCRGFYANRLERLRYDDAVRAAGDEPLMAAIQAMDEARPRSSKTARARAEAKWGVGPSDFGACRKQIEYRERPPDGYEPVEVDRSSAYEGTLLHDGITAARKVRYPWREYGKVVHVPGFDVPGECDEYDGALGLVVDYKTAGSWKWEQLGNNGPPDPEWKQVLTYALGIEDAGGYVEYVELHYYNRENFRDPERFRRRYDRQAALAACAPLLAVLDDLDAGRELPRDRSGPTTDSICARFCPAVEHCWQVRLADLHLRTPEGWMQARSDVGVEVALREYVEAHEQIKPFNDTKDAAKAKVTDVPWGRYGEFTYRMTGGNRKDDVPDDDARREQLEFEMRQAIAEGRPPMNPETMPHPMKPYVTRRTTEIKRVRAAILADPLKIPALAVPEGTDPVDGTYQRQPAAEVEDRG